MQLFQLNRFSSGQLIDFIQLNVLDLLQSIEINLFSVIHSMKIHSIWFILII